VSSASKFRTLALVHGAYYVATGIWSLVDIRSFQRVTGPKTDLWLVRTVGSLVAVGGGVLCYAGARRRRTPEAALLAVGSALALAGIDVYYTARGRIRPIYLADAAAELGLVAGWLRWGRPETGRPDRDHDSVVVPKR
jgi:hypothetical protein